MESNASGALNHAVAVALGESLEQGLRLSDDLKMAGVLNGSHLLHAARADLLRRLGRAREPAEAYRRALELATNEVERDYFRRRLEPLVL
jgi:RNA polymerase sigma-70 factor (ECF subfamily)